MHPTRIESVFNCPRWSENDAREVLAALDRSGKPANYTGFFSKSRVNSLKQVRRAACCGAVRHRRVIVSCAKVRRRSSTRINAR